ADHHTINRRSLHEALPITNNLIYNRGITTYIWILSNNKAQHRKGKVQLNDAGQLYRKLRKNLGNKNCEFSQDHIREIVQVYEEIARKSTRLNSSHVRISYA